MKDSSGKSLEEVLAISERFFAKYWTASVAMYSCGVGADDEGNYCISVRFRNDDGVDTIPAEFEGVKVFVEVDDGPITLCRNCRGAYTLMAGPCSECGYETNSCFKLCEACSLKFNQCQHCRTALNLKITSAVIARIDEAVKRYKAESTCSHSGHRCDAGKQFDADIEEIIAALSN